jgi:hypothetical protein
MRLQPWGSPPKFHDDPSNLRYEPERGQLQAPTLKRRGGNGLAPRSSKAADVGGVVSAWGGMDSWWWRRDVVVDGGEVAAAVGRFGRVVVVLRVQGIDNDEACAAQRRGQEQVLA